MKYIEAAMPGSQAGAADRTTSPHWRATKGEPTLKSKLTLTAELALSGKNVIPSNYHGHFQLISEQILDQ